MRRNKTKKPTQLEGLVDLRFQLAVARRALRDALPMAHGQSFVRVAADVSSAESQVAALLVVLEKHWPTVDLSGRCQGCPRCVS